MPALGAAAVAVIRVAIQAAVTTGIWIGVDKIILPYLKNAVQDYMIANGATEEEAIDSVANDVIDILGTFGAIGISIRSKMPTKIAEYLGFTTKGWKKRTIFTRGAPPKPGTVMGPVPPAAIVTAGAASASVAALTKLKSLGKGAAVLAGFLEKRAQTAFLAALVVTGLVDFGNWETGAYSDFFQKLFATVTGGILVPNEDYRKTKTVSPEVFDKVYNTYKLAGAVSINNPYTGQKVVFSRDALIDLLDQVGADLLLKTGGASTKDVIEASQFLISFSTAAVQQHANSIGYYGPVYSGSSVPPTTAPKVYTGIVSQGVLGRGLEFVPRQDDLIESAEELKEAAANNLAPFMQSLLGKVVYEVKIVSSIITKEGFKQTGVVQQIRNGSYADGKPKFKSVYNKFATLDLYVITDKGARSKITTIVLGPTDSAKLNLGTAELRSVEAAIPALVFTSDINDITGIETISAVTVSTPGVAGGTPAPAPDTGVSVTSAMPASTQAPSTTILGASALTLTSWYAARGQSVPPIAARAILYESLGLGKVDYYTGTSEQNTKLLAALKIDAINDRIEELRKKQKEQEEDEEKGSSTSKQSSSSGTKKSTKQPKAGVADETGKVVSRWSKQSNGDYIVTYKDGTKRTIRG